MTPDEVAGHLHLWVDRLATVAGQRPPRIPGHEFADFGTPFYGVLPDGRFILEAWERGQRCFQRSTDDLDELLYWIVDSLANQLASDMALRDPAYRGLGDPRRLWFPQWERWMIQLNPEWGTRTAQRIADILQRSPYRD